MKRRPVKTEIRALLTALLIVLGGLSAVSLAAASGATGESASDLQTSVVLREGVVDRSEEIGEGVTLPQRIWLTYEGEEMTAAFKSVHKEQIGLVRFENAPPELNFTDSFHYDRAAYLLDRRIGLGMVPVTVPRRIGNKEGVLVAWVDGSITEAERRELDLRPADPGKLADQRSLMRLFDALIFNIDRNQGNELITRRDWKLHLIDHTRAFRLARSLPAAWERRPAMLTRALHENLRSLEEEELVQLLKGEVARGRVRALLIRRDLILEKIERDLQTYGEMFVYAAERSVK